MNPAPASALSADTPANITVDTAGPGRAISPDLIGIFFEDISYAADGGLYAELIQNRSFEYQPTEQQDWTALSFWQLVQRGAGSGSISVDASIPLNPRNPHYLVIDVAEPGEGVGVSNPGFDGIPVVAGEEYHLSFFAKQLFMERRWGGRDEIEGQPMPVVIRIENKEGAPLGEAAFQIEGREWKQREGQISATGTDPAARLVLLAKAAGGIAVDEVSLFPARTFKGRRNGLRADLAQAIADLKPKFVRFPGGCVAHGNGLGNIYRWKDTIGPLEERKGMSNLWGYHQSMGLGYFEYFQFCEDIGARPLPVLAAGVCCQNSGYTAGQGQRGIPMEEMPAYIQDVLDLIEWANGPATSPWGARRAAAGHHEPFGLEYLGIGNEDRITPVFKERFKMIYDAVKARHPEIVVIGTVGPFHKGEDYDKGWQIANELNVPMVDEHYYETPEWFWDNLQRYDAYDRTKSKVYLGEYAAFDGERRSTLRAAIAEAAYLTSLERNADVVHFASYAPLLARRGYVRWSPDLIYFSGTGISPTISYSVQQLFSLNCGDSWLETRISGSPAMLAASAVRDSQSGDLILKIVNGANEERPLKVHLLEAENLPKTGTRTVLAGPDPNVQNEDGQSPAVSIMTLAVELGALFEYAAPANSLTIFRLGNRSSR